ncbi:MoaD/ThiS family protein [Pedobacter sandarakinus]|uniref:MoaD/ThiS family protein n=1 Tax=Pedobacter sandarakinus TaxID=353156 RepID=UPI0022459D72|nr:MoaD/ThiS family protein [Pedobacter sandarakinus]MCX2575302.1 MoaD/ThiS family protein [Pedobacter sandarakinus]
MEINLITFGKITDFAKPQTLLVNNVNNSDELKNHLEERFPELRQIKYKLAVNEALVQTNVPVPENATVAILPPFSGG